MTGPASSSGVWTWQMKSRAALPLTRPCKAHHAQPLQRPHVNMA